MSKKKKEHWRIETTKEALRACQRWQVRYIHEMGGKTKCNPAELKRYADDIEKFKSQLETLRLSDLTDVRLFVQ